MKLVVAIVRPEKLGDVLESLFRGQADLGGGEAGALAVRAEERAEPVAGLVPEAVPLPAGGGGLPEGLRHQMGVNVDRSHG